MTVPLLIVKVCVFVFICVSTGVKYDLQNVYINVNI